MKRDWHIKKSGGRRPGAGRKPQGEPLTETLVVMVSKRTAGRIRRVARQAGVSIGAVVRAILDTKIKQ